MIGAIELLAETTAYADGGGAIKVIGRGARGTLLYEAMDNYLVDFHYGAHGLYWICYTTSVRKLSPLEALAMEA